jgi:hypothetical protein
MQLRSTATSVERIAQIQAQTINQPSQESNQLGPFIASKRHPRIDNITATLL